MAFTAAQRLKIRVYLGYPSINRYRDPRLEGAIDVIGQDTDAQAMVEALFLKIESIDTSLTSALGTAGLKRAEDIEWYQASSGSSVGPEILSKRAEGRRFTSRLSQLMGVPLYGDYFGGGGYPGDEYMGTGNQYGRPLKLG